MTPKIKSRLFQMLIPEIMRLSKARYTQKEIMDKLNEDYSADFKFATFKKYFTRYRDLLNKDNEVNNQEFDYQNLTEKENTLFLENDKDKLANDEKKIKTTIDNSVKSDIISTTDNQSESVEKKALSLTEKALNYSASETNAKINDKVKDLLRMNKP